MVLQFVNILHCVKLFVIVWLHVDKTSSITLSALKSVCCIDTGTEYINTLGGAKRYCTAISSFSENERTTTEDIECLRGNLPYVYIYDDEPFGKMQEHIEAENVEEFLNKIAKLIIENKIDAMVFDNFYPDVRNSEIHMGFQKNLRNFFQMLKARFTKNLFGLLIPKDKKILEKAFIPSVIDSSIGFYIIRSLSYYTCERKNHQREMVNTSPVDMMENTLQMLRAEEYNLKKILLDIRIIVNNVNYFTASGKDDNSYSYQCSNDPPKDWGKYCSESLEGFYEKAYLVKKYNLLGAFIHSLDRDDYNNNCGCGAYSAMTVIDAALRSTGIPKVIGCPKWGLLPRDQNKPPKGNYGGNDG